MNTKNIFLIIVLAAVMTGTLVIIKQYQKPASSKGQAQNHHVTYYCPMHPNYTSNSPGVCPICGMTLVLRHEHSQEPAVGIQGYVPVNISAEKQQLANIRTAVVERGDIVRTVRAVGYISTNNDLYKLQDEYVQDYDNFVMIYRDFKRYEHTRRNWESHRELQLKLHDEEDKLLTLGLGQEQIRKLQKFSWKTPWDQQDLLFFNDTFKYWVVAQIFENDLRFVQPGELANVEIPAYGQKVKGMIRSIGGVIDPQSRTVNALIEIKNEEGELKGNMFVNVEVPVTLRGVIVVPKEAVMDTGLRKIVFIQEGVGLFVPQVIQTGWETDNGFEVKSGLNVGQRIAVSGNFLLDSESRVQAALGGDGHG